jgi:glycerol kinase
MVQMVKGDRWTSLNLPGSQARTIRSAYGTVQAQVLDADAYERSRPAVTETTALGAAFLAGLHAGVFGSVDVIRRVWESERRFTPAMSDAERQRLHQGWLKAVGRVRTG